MGIFCSSCVKYTFWETPAAGFEIDKAISSGFTKILSANFLIFGAIVALNKSVCFCLGKNVISFSDFLPIEILLDGIQLALDKFILFDNSLQNNLLLEALLCLI